MSLSKAMKRLTKHDKPGIAGVNVGDGLLQIVITGFIILMFAIVAGRAYSTQETSIAAITNTAVKTGVQDVAVNTFNAFKDISAQLTLFTILFVLLVVVAIAYSARSSYGGGGGYERVM